MYVKPSNTSPAARRKAQWEREQKARNAAAQALLVKATVKS